MKPKLILNLLLIATVSLNALVAVTTRAGDVVMPLITMDSVPFTDAVKNLARQAGTNFILDAKVLQSSQPPITQRWTNSTARTALDDLLKTRKLRTINNPVTGVLRIALQQENAQPISAAELGTDPGSVIPLIAMEEVPLSDAVQALARQAGLTYVLGPAVSLSSPQLVNIRFQNVTAKKALVALLDAYGLALAQNPGDPSAKIVNQP